MIKYGSSNIGKIFFGSNTIGKAYLGSQLVYQSGGGPTPPTPTVYDAEVEYLESTGTQYFDLGFIPTQVIAFTIEIYRGNNNLRWDCGAEVGWSSKILRLLIQEGNKQAVWRYGLSNPSGGNITNSSNCVGRLRLVTNGRGATINNLTSGATYNSSASVSSAFDATCNFLLFGINVAGVPDIASVSSGVRLYSATITDSNVNLDLIPVRIGQVGYLYDQNSGTLFQNAGTGSFVLGPDVN